MKTIEEIVRARFENETQPPIGKFKLQPIRDCMIMYAEQYARNCLNIAANEIKESRDNGSDLIYYGYAVQSVLNITLPEHE